MRARTASLFGAMALLSVAVPVRGQETALEWGERMERDEVLEVKTITGDVKVTLASGREAEVVATKRGRRRDFEDVDVRVVHESDGYTVCVVYFPRDFDGDGCDDHGDHRGGRNRSVDVEVDLEVRVPAGVEFIGSSVTGNVDVNGLRSDVTASSVSGDIFVTTTGVAHGTTVSGDVEIEMGSNDWRDLDFHTVSGDITLRLPGDLDAEVEFESLSGEFDSDFDLNVTRRRDRFVGSSLRATIGRGGRTLSFKTVSGDVRLRRSRGRSPL